MKYIEITWSLLSADVCVDYGYGPQFAASFPTGALAGEYARDANMAECERKVSAFVEAKRKRYPNVEVVTR